MRRISVLLLSVGLLVVTAAAAIAQKPQKDPSGSIDLESYSQTYLGGTVGFDTSVSGLTGNQYPMVAVWCYQNDNLVYMELRQPNDELVLGGASSQWLTNGGPAACDAVLYAYQWKGGQESIYALASKHFDADGSSNGG